MTQSAADLSTAVHYSTDRWQMDRVPWAMWFCVAGLAICLHTESRGVPGAALALVYLALLALAFAGWAGTSLIERSGYPWYVVVPLVIVIVVVVAGFISLFGSSRGYPAYGRLWWSQLVHPPLNVFGWMLLYLGGGWIAFALLRTSIRRGRSFRYRPQVCRSTGPGSRTYLSRGRTFRALGRSRSRTPVTRRPCIRARWR